MEIIRVENLSKSYFSQKKKPGVLSGIKDLFRSETIEKKAVNDISFRIEEGEFVGFLGPNGAGKTTTLKMLSGIIKPTSGKVSVLGFDPWDRKNDYKKQFALLMGQKNQLWWDLPVMESFLLNKKIYGILDAEYEESLDELVSLLDVSKILDIQVRKLSLGERMKCELIASLLHRPKVLFLDEPTIGLDVIAQKSMRDFLRRYNKEKKITVILTSHYMEDIERLCERIIIINQKVFYDGPLKDLIDKYVRDKTLSVTFTEAVERKAIGKFGPLVEFDPVRAVFKVPKAEIRNVARDILSSDLPVDDILIDEMDTESIIRNIFEKTNG